MTVSEEKQLQAIRDGYENWTGAPDRVIEFRRQETDEHVPSALDVLIFLPPEGPNEDDVTLLGTAGMSLRTMSGPETRVELVIEIKGTPDEETLDGLAKDLAELAALPFREGRAFAPNIVLEGIEFDAFPRMRHALLTNWAFVDAQYLPEVDPPVLLLRLLPLFPSEVDFIEQAGHVTGISSLVADDVLFEDFDRLPAR